MDRKDKLIMTILEIAKKVDEWIAKPAVMERFRQQFREFCKFDCGDRYFLLELPYDEKTEEMAELMYPKEEEPTDEEKLLAHYAKLTIIHDKRLKGITRIKINNGIWPEKGEQDANPQDVYDHFKEMLHIPEAQTDIQCSFNQVKGDLNQYLREAEKKGLFKKIIGWIFKKTFNFIIFLAALLTFISLLWWLWTTFWSK